MALILYYQRVAGALDDLGVYYQSEKCLEFGFVVDIFIAPATVACATRSQSLIDSRCKGGALCE